MDFKSTFEENLPNVFKKLTSHKPFMQVSNKLSCCYQHEKLITIYTAFARPHLDYGDIEHLTIISRIDWNLFNVTLALQ